MEKVRYLIIGGGPSGTSAAESIRLRDKDGSITIVDAEGKSLYSKLLLHKFIAGEINEDQLTIRKPDWYRQNEIELIKDDIVDVKNKYAILASGRTIEFDKVLFSSGSRARILANQEKKGLFSLRNLTDAIAIRDYALSSQSITVVGGGLIATDILDGFLHSGKTINLVLREKKLLEGKIHPKGCEMLENILQENGVKIYKETEVTEVAGSDRVEFIILKNGERIETDLVIAGIGVEADFDYLKETNIATNKGILVDELMRTNVDWAWASGDVCEHPVKGFTEKAVSGNWLLGQISGRIAGASMAGAKEEFDLVPVSSKSLGETSIGYFGDYLSGAQPVDVEKENAFVRIFVKDGKVCNASIVGSLIISKKIRTMIGGEFNRSEP